MNILLELNKSEFVKKENKFYIWKLGKDRLEDFTDFIFKVYLETSGEHANIDPEKEYDRIKTENNQYFPFMDVMLAVLENGKIIGSTGGILYSEQFKLPYESKFNISKNEILQLLNIPTCNFVESGRTAVDKKLMDKVGMDPNRAMNIMRELLDHYYRDLSKG